MKHEQTEGLLTAQQVSEMAKISIRSIWILRRRNMLPREVSIGCRMVRWRKSDILMWIEWGCPSQAYFEAKKADDSGNKDYLRLSRDGKSTKKGKRHGRRDKTKLQVRAV